MNNVLKNLDAEDLGQQLKYARKREDLTQEDIAEILGVARTTITAIENGERKLRPAEIMKIAEKFGKSVHDLLRIQKPSEPFQVQFRAAYDRTKEEDETVKPIIDKFEALCRDYYELENIVNGNVYRNYPVTYDISNAKVENAAESIAIKERNRLGLGDGPLSMLRDILEQDVGLRIFYIKMPAKYSEMYTYNNVLGGCMAINSHHPEVRRRWSMSHGYAHFLTHRKESVVEQDQRVKRVPRKEKFADEFAKHFLMPTNSIINKYNDIKATKEAFTIADLFIMAHYYGVSTQAMTKRLEGMNLIEIGTWQKLKEKDINIGEIKRKFNLEELPQRDDKFPRTYQYFSLYAYSKGLITEGQFARFLRMNRMEARKLANELQLDSYDELELEKSL